MNDLKIKYYDEEIDIFNEVLMVSKTTFTATLSRIPSNRKIFISHGYTSLTEVDTEPNINEFKVDRNTGEILFNSAMAGEKLIVDYHAIGKFCVSADNVSTNVDSNGNVIETLEGYLQKNKEIIDSVNTIGDGATVFNQLEAHIESAKNLMGNVIEGGNVNDKLVKTINNSKKADANLNESINSANTKITEMNEWVDQHGDIVNLDNRVDGVEKHIPKINEQLETKANISDVAKISSGTPLIVDSVSEMIDNTKNYVLESTGEIYTWENGNITQTTMIYQGTAIQENSVDLLEISEELRNTLTNKDKAELISVENGFYKIDGTLTGDNDLRQKKYNVVSGEVYEVFIRFGWQAVGVSFFNVNDEFISYKYYTPNSSTGNTPVKRTIKIPINATSMKITCMESSGLDNYYANKITLKEIKECENTTTPTKNGKHVFMGDSLTDESTLGKGVKNYVNFVTERLGLTSINIGMGGTGYLADNGKENPEYNFLKRKNLIPSDATSVTIFGSFNDLFISNYTIGNVGDTDTTTMHGAFNTLIKEIYKINPSMKIGIISPTPWVGRNQRHEEEERRNGAINYVNFLEEACKYNSLPFLNLFYTSGVRTWDTDFNNRYTKGGDGVHPNSVGHEIFITPQVTAFIDSII